MGHNHKISLPPFGRNELKAPQEEIDVLIGMEVPRIQEVRTALRASAFGRPLPAGRKYDRGKLGNRFAGTPEGRMDALIGLWSKANCSFPALPRIIWYNFTLLNFHVV